MSSDTLSVQGATLSKNGTENGGKKVKDGQDSPERSRKLNFPAGEEDLNLAFF